MSKYAIALVLLLALAGAGEWHGHHRGYASGVVDTQAAADKRVQQADERATQATAERNAATTRLARVNDALAEQKARLEMAHVVADAAMADRNRIQRVLDRTTTERKTAVKDAAHAQADCAALDHEPVCPAVADRLWGSQPSAAAVSH